MSVALSRSEKILLALGATLLAAAVLGPPLAQHTHYHAFADQRTLLGIPCALDVLSNLPFAIAGLLGFVGLRRAPAGTVAPAQRQMAALFFAGLLCTALASGLYHGSPDDRGLVMDRSGMLVAFAGLLGLAAADRVGARAGRWLAAAVLVGGVAAVAVWAWSGNLLPWALLQGGGMALVLGFALCRPLPGALAVRWATVIAIYVLAKLLELGDGAVFAATGEWLSGHTLKHVVASLAAWPVLAALWKATNSGQNRPDTGTGPIVQPGGLPSRFLTHKVSS